MLAFISFTGIYGFYSCKKTDAINNSYTTNPLGSLNLPALPYNYANPPLPGFLYAQTIKALDNTPATNTVTDWGATLGRVLFYDKTLSVNNTVSCASCHKQALSFADDIAFSIGFAGDMTLRNAMSLVDTRYYPNGNFLWDERGTSLEIQTLLPIQDHIEMGLNLDSLPGRLYAKEYYPLLFQKAFGRQAITIEKAGNALAQFIRSIVSSRSNFDAGRAMINSMRLPYPNFTEQENEGKQLFTNPLLGCNGCHMTETFTAATPKNNGLDYPSVDPGVGGITNNPLQVGDFKVPSLKNIELTAPYMHDGRFATLEEVIEHYNSSVKPHPNLSPQLRNPDGSPKKLNLTEEQKAALVAFLKTLTDRSIISDTKFSNPFK